MGFTFIENATGEPLDMDSGTYLTFSEIDYADDKARFMRDYKLLPTWKSFSNVEYCEDIREFDAMRDTMTICARLAAFAYGRHVGERQPKREDLDRINRLETRDACPIIDILDETQSGGIFCGSSAKLTLNLSASPAYLRYVESMCEFMERMREESSISIADIGLPPEISEKLRGINGHIRIYEPAMFGFLGIPHGVTSSDHHGAISITAHGATVRDAVICICDTLFAIHLDNMECRFTPKYGLTLTTSHGICALWADFASCLAKRPITICDECGLPIMRKTPPRGQPLKYCGQPCKQAVYRRRKASNAKDG